MDFLGWYSTGETPTEADVHVHKQVKARSFLRQRKMIFTVKRAILLVA
jgi:hypothetical protein